MDVWPIHCRLLELAFRQKKVRYLTRLTAELLFTSRQHVFSHFFCFVFGPLQEIFWHGSFEFLSKSQCCFGRRTRFHVDSVFWVYLRVLFVYIFIFNLCLFRGSFDPWLLHSAISTSVLAIVPRLLRAVQLWSFDQIPVHSNPFDRLIICHSHGRAVMPGTVLTASRPQGFVSRWGHFRP